RLDVRLDTRLLKRFAVCGGAQGRPAATSYAGGGEPNFAGDPRWGKYNQVDGDAGLEGSVHVAAGTSPRGRAVREGTLGAGRPSAATAAGQGHHGRQRVHESGERGLGPDRWTVHEGRTGEGHAQPPRGVHLSACPERRRGAQTSC